MPRRTAKDWDNEILQLETKLDRCQRDLFDVQTAFHGSQKALVETRLILEDVMQDGGERARIVELERALFDVLKLMTSGEGGGNPYGKKPVQRAFMLLTGNIYGET